MIIVTSKRLNSSNVIQIYLDSSIKKAERLCEFKSSGLINQPKPNFTNKN